MEALKTSWFFFQNEILGMAWLNRLIGSLLSRLGLDITGRMGGSIQFFCTISLKLWSYWAF